MLTASYADVTLQFADSWESLTLAQYTSLVTATTDYAMLQAICSQPDTLDLLPDANAGQELVDRLPFLKSEAPTFAEWPVPDVVLIAGKPLPLPGNLGLESFGQMMATESVKGSWLDVCSLSTCIRPSAKSRTAIS